MKPNKNHVFTVGMGLMAVLLVFYPTRTRSQTRGKPDEGRVNRLLDVMKEREPSMPVPAEIEKSTDAKLRQEYFAKRQLRFDEHKARINAAIDELAAMGDDVVDLVVRRYHAPIGSPRHQIIVVLAKIATPRARKTLLDIATAKNDPTKTSYASWAARNFVKIAPNKEAMLPLLNSDNADVTGVALQNLPGVSVDRDLLDHLKGFLQSTTYHPVVNVGMRTAAASVLVGDKGSVLVREELEALVDSLRTVDDMPGAQEKYQSDAGGNLADHMYYYLVDALTKIEGAAPFLREAKDSLQGKPRAAVVVALALRGDSAVKEELLQVPQDPLMASMTSMRWHALRALGIIGTREDIPFLERHAREDPLEVIDFGGPIFERVNGQYINTGSRMAPIRPESDPTWQTARRSYPIRGAATQAIRAIEKRLGN